MDIGWTSHGQHPRTIKKAPRIFPKRFIFYDTILPRFFRGKMDTTWTRHGQNMDKILLFSEAERRQIPALPDLWR